MPISMQKTRSGEDCMEISARKWEDLEEALECLVSLGDIIKLYLGDGKGIVYARISRITTQKVPCYFCGSKFEPSRRNSMICSPTCFKGLMSMGSARRAQIFKKAIADRKVALAAIQAED